jgi:hypothetical protein
VDWDIYWFAATALIGAADFQGSKPIVKLTFHIELDPCYPTVYSTVIGFTTGQPIPTPQVSNSSGTVITSPELVYGINVGSPATYTISAPQPIVEIVLTNMSIRRNVPQQTFDAYVNIKLGIKVKDFYIVITYPSDAVEPVNVTFGDYLPGPAFITRGFRFEKWHDTIVVWAEEDPAQSPHAYGNGTLFIIEFKVIKAVFWNNPPPNGMIAFDKTVSYLSVCCPAPKKQMFNPDVHSHDAAYSYDPLPGDLNFDGYVDISDLILLAHAYAPGVWIPAGKPYDVNLDHYVDILDLVLVAMHYHDHI